MRRRTSLWWLVVPVVMFAVATPFVNRLEPVLLGLPFFFLWTLVSVVVTPIAIWLAARGDPVYRADAEEPTLVFGRDRDEGGRR